MQQLFRYEDAWLPNLLAFSYTLLSYLLGLIAISQSSLFFNLLGTLLLAHSMVIAAYLVHECAHNSLFKKNSWHETVAEVFLWVCGSSYSNYEEVRLKHVKHHTQHADIIAYDYRALLQQHPKLLRIIQKLEWLYIPAVELLMHLLVIVLPFVNPGRSHNRTRVVTVLLLRALFFILLASISLSALFFYAIAYMLFLHVIHFMDVHQHTYEVYLTLDSGGRQQHEKKGREFEQRNTYSNLFSKRYPWLNLITLNFGYHNAHHYQPGMPWYKLPTLDRNLPTEMAEQKLPINNLLKSYHRYRVARVLNGDPEDMDVLQDQGHSFIGVDGISFLTAH